MAGQLTCAGVAEGGVSPVGVLGTDDASRDAGAAFSCTR
jgi:hypothetical protein